MKRTLALLVSLSAASFSSVSSAKTDKHSSLSLEQSGVASYFSDKLHGQRTASGEVYDKNALTAVHAHLPFGTLLRVVNLANNRTINLRINGRPGKSNKRLLDVSRRVAQELGFVQAGLANVKFEVVRLGAA